MAATEEQTAPAVVMKVETDGEWRKDAAEQLAREEEARQRQAEENERKRQEAARLLQVQQAETFSEAIRNALGLEVDVQPGTQAVRIDNLLFGMYGSSNVCVALMRKCEGKGCKHVVENRITSRAHLARVILTQPAHCAYYPDCADVSEESGTETPRVSDNWAQIAKQAFVKAEAEAARRDAEEREKQRLACAEELKRQLSYLGIPSDPPGPRATVGTHLFEIATEDGWPVRRPPYLVVPCTGKWCGHAGEVRYQVHNQIQLGRLLSGIDYNGSPLVPQCSQCQAAVHDARQTAQEQQRTPADRLADAVAAIAFQAIDARENF